ncbi:MAG: SBBP repeat-containing protein [Candidatus Tenebribacter davisii]|nr:SBBP repeat-containing protein [Candidatus Tenebribacter davisii]
MKKALVGLIFIIFTITLSAQEPEWQWASQAGGSSVDVGESITIDDDGNSYVTGIFSETAPFGFYSLTSSGSYDIFVAKMDANGNWLWATKAGGSGSDYGDSIAIDGDGNSYVTGSFEETATFGSYSLTSSGSADIFVAKMDANGNWLWVTKAGGSSCDDSYGITIDSNGSSYVTGRFGGTATFGSYSLTSSGSADIFVAKMDVNGNWLWATQAGGSGFDFGESIAIDGDGNSYITGNFSATATFGSYSLTSSGSADIFVAKMDANGNWLWVTKAGGSSWDDSYGITIDSNGSSYVTGDFSATATFGSYSLTSSGSADIFVAKLGNDTSVDNYVISSNIVLTNYPNPFNPLTTIQFNLKENETGILTISNIKGQLIESHQFGSGSHTYDWDASKQSSGIYLYKLNVNGKTKAVKKCLLLK